MTNARHTWERIAAQAVTAHTEGHTTKSPRAYSRAAGAYALAATLARQVAREAAATRHQDAAAAANYWNRQATNHEQSAQTCQRYAVSLD